MQIGVGLSPFMLFGFKIYEYSATLASKDLTSLEEGAVSIFGL